MLCGSCKYYEQGKHCSFCGHPKATKEERQYRYYNFSCDTDVKWEEGIAQSRVDFIKGLPAAEKSLIKRIKEKFKKYGK